MQPIRRLSTPLRNGPGRKNDKYPAPGCRLSTMRRTVTDRGPAWLNAAASATNEDSLDDTDG